MKTNKPEVVAEVHQHLNNLVVDWKSPTSDSVCVAGDQLIRLSDYEALATECEKLRAEYEEELFQVRQDRDTHFGELMRALEQVDAMKTECEKLRKDSERIEWLGEQTKKSYTGISFDYHRYVEDGYVVDHGYRFMRRHFASGFKDSLRKAIDAAMEGDQP